jgi:hypothetical protein
MVPVGTGVVTAAILAGAVLVLSGSTLATSTTAPRVPPHAPAPRAAVTPAPHRGDWALYSPHARKLVQTYLRLRLLESREADLERVRAVIERRLSVDRLLDDETPPRKQ